ncbi:hypothetical protein [Chroococcidiopsis sp.]|uniref:hypothetical protein n=1 Tax=Chroococcidiopsis sp. TaxID=3088168 RepID=UPI003F3CE0B8
MLKAPTNPTQDELKAIAKYIIQQSYDDGVASLALERTDNGFAGQFSDATDPKKIMEYTLEKSGDTWELGYKALSGVEDTEDFSEVEVEPIWNEPPFDFGEEEIDPADLYTSQAIALAAPIFSEWLEQVENHIFDGATDLSQVRDRIESAFGEMDAADFAQLMQETMLAGYGAGRYQVQEETAIDEEFAETLEFATKKSKNPRTCKKGFPCGNSCISRTKMCKKRLEGQYATAAQWLESKLLPLPNKKNHFPHTEFIEQGYSAIGTSRMAEIDSLLKGDPIEKERLSNEYMAVQKEFMAALDNNKMRVRDREAVRAKHKAAEDAYFNYEKYNRRQAAQKMEEFRLQLVSEGLSRTEAKKTLETIDFDTDSLNSINKSLKGDFTRTDLDEAIIEFRQLTNSKSSASLKSVKNSYFADGRAYATRTGDLSIGSSPDKRVIFHELGHHLEFESDTTLQAAKSWIESRKTGEPKKLNELTDSPYDDDEIAYPDKFIKPYVGKIYPDATEVISMGIEHFTSGRMMLELYEKDSEHFAFTVGAIRQ